MCEVGSLGGGSGDMTSDVTAVTANCATSGALCVRPGGRQAVCAYGERCGSPARRRDVCTRVRTYGLTDVIDPGGNTVNVASQPGGRPHRHAWLPRPSARRTHGIRTPLGRVFARHIDVESAANRASVARAVVRP